MRYKTLLLLDNKIILSSDLKIGHFQPKLVFMKKLFRPQPAFLTAAAALMLLSAGCLRGKFELHGLSKRGAEGAAKLLSSDCINPDLAKLTKGQMITLCDGSLAEGAAERPAACAADGEQNCVNKDDFKAVKVTSVEPADIKLGKTVAGIVGSKRDMKRCRNAADLATYDSTYAPSNLPRTFGFAAVNTGSDTLDLGFTHGLSADSPVHLTTTGGLPAPLVVGQTYYVIVASATTVQLASAPGGAAIDLTTQGTGNHTSHHVGDGVVSYFDTIEDLNNSKPNSPSQGPWGADFICDATNFTNVTGEIMPTGTVPTNGNQSFTEVWRDELTGMLVTNVLYSGGGSTSWSQALALCSSISGSVAGTGWRLPTHKEALQLYVDGIAKVPIAGGSLNQFFWASSAVASNLTWAWRINFASGFATVSGRAATTYSVLCIR